MSKLQIRHNALGFELWDGDRLVTIYRATEELDREESPKPCFAPIYTPSGGLITGYRPKDHLWHTGLYYGWVYANESNLWGGPWYLPSSGKYELVPNTHGRQAHEGFHPLSDDRGVLRISETVSWRDSKDATMAVETRSLEFAALADRPGTAWKITSEIRPSVDKLTLGASKAAGYSGLMLRMGPPYSDANHRSSEGKTGHEATMGQKARWCLALGAAGGPTGGCVVMMDHPKNPRHPAKWFTRQRLLGTAVAMDGEISVAKGEALTLRYALAVLDGDPEDPWIEERYRGFAG